MIQAYCSTTTQGYCIIMTYSEITEIAKQGKLGKLPNFIGYFKWDFGSNSLIFYNGDYRCPAESLDVLNRNDFYYII